LWIDDDMWCVEDLGLESGEVRSVKTVFICSVAW